MVSLGQNIKMFQVVGLNTAMAAKAPLVSPTFTGNPVAPTQTTTDNSTKLATTAFVQANFTATAINFGTGTFIGSGTSGSPYTLGLFTANNTYSGTQTYNISAIGATPTDQIFYNNTTLTTASVTVQTSPAINYLTRAWNTTGAADNALNARMYYQGVSGASTFGSYKIDMTTNGGTTYSNVFAVNGFSQVSFGQAIISGNMGAGTILVKPGSSTAFNSTATATAAQMATQVATSTSAAPTTITTATASALLTQLNGTSKSWFPWRVDNISGASIVTIGLGTGFTSGSTGTPLTITAGAAAMYEIYFPTTTTAIIYRVGQ